MERITYGGWANCYRLSNGAVELIITGDVGPRIIRFGLVGGENELKEYPDMLGLTGGDTWRLYGGHRLWHAPEAMPRSYYPDNSPVEVAQHAGFVRVSQPPEPTTGIAKQIDIALDPSAARATITHRLTNAGMWPVELAPWALSVMAQGGVAILPLPPFQPHTEEVRPATTLTLWSYTNFQDPRWTWGQRYILLRQDPSVAAPQKVGLNAAAGWIGYARAGRLFVKRVAYTPGARYPDMGCTLETFTNDEMLEIETLAPLRTLAPGESAEHVEEWQLFAGVPTPTSDTDVDQHILPLL